MLHPSYTDLMNAVNNEVDHSEQPTVNSRYSIVIATSKRARQLIDEKNESNETSGLCFKPLSAAVNELYKGDVKILTEEEIAEAEEDVANVLQSKQMSVQQRSAELSSSSQDIAEDNNWAEEDVAAEELPEEDIEE